jgi:GntR family transcriptional repressor for pyruvate dehydrogenase complex
MLARMSTGASAWLRDDDGVTTIPAYEVVAARMRRAIHLGELAPGSKLPAERILSERLGVSRVTLREAIRVLEGERYVEVSRGRGGGTTVHTGSMSPEEISAWMGRRWKELEAIFDFRLVNERRATERAATRADASQLRELREIAEQGSQATDVNEFRTWDVRFHLSIADLAESTLLRQAVEEARAELYVPFRAVPLERLLKVSGLQHLAIVTALEKGDPRRAGKAMEKHLTAATAQMEELAGVDGG